MSRLEAIILHLVHHSTRPPTKTSLMKLVYFADYWSVRCYGDRLTDCAWEQDQFGIVDYAIPDAAEDLGREGKLLVSMSESHTGRPMWEYRPSGGSADEGHPLRTQDVVLLDYILARYAGLSAQALGDMTKKTEPWDSCAPKRARVDMGKIPDTCSLRERPELWLRQRDAEELDFSERGTARERATHATAMYESFSDSRRRATQECMQRR